MSAPARELGALLVEWRTQREAAAEQVTSLGARVARSPEERAAIQRAQHAASGEVRAYDACIRQLTAALARHGAGGA